MLTRTRWAFIHFYFTLLVDNILDAESQQISHAKRRIRAKGDQEVISGTLSSQLALCFQSRKAFLAVS